MSLTAAAAQQAWHSLAVLLVLRVLPVILFLLVTPQTNLRQKMVTLITAVAFFAITRGWTLVPWAWYGAAYAYLIGAACLVPTVARRLQNRRMSRGGTFLVCLFAFLLFPGFLWPPAMKLVALVFAWDLVLSSYSYCIETARSSEPPSRRDCLFFLFVNPALVYSQRGHHIGPASFDRVGLWRILLGALMFLTTWLLLMPFFRLVNQRSAGNGLSGLAYADLILCGSIAFAIQYAQASGLASLQIGLLRQTGHLIPERYDWPIRAKTLPEFWRRWNTYVSQWALHYVFWPFSLRLGRRFRDRRSRTLITIFALVGAFLVIGILHDAYTSLVPLVAKYHLTLMFLVNGILVVLWLGLERIGQRAEEDGRLPKWVVPLASTISRVCLWCFVAACALWRISI